MRLRFGQLKGEALQGSRGKDSGMTPEKGAHVAARSDLS
jgi:hypothetical protein